MYSAGGNVRRINAGHLGQHKNLTVGRAWQRLALRVIAPLGLTACALLAAVMIRAQAEARTLRIPMHNYWQVSLRTLVHAEQETGRTQNKSEVVVTCLNCGAHAPHWRRLFGKQEASDIGKGLPQHRYFSDEQIPILTTAYAAVNPIRAVPVIVPASMRSSRNEIPFTLHNGHLVVVRGDLGTLRDLPLLLDTGTNPTAISKQVAGLLDLHGIEQPLVFSNGTKKVQIVTLPSIRIGEARKAGIKTMVRDLSYFEKEAGVTLAGIVGIDVLSASNFMIDYQRRKIVFARTNLGKKRVQFDSLTPLLTVRAKIDGQVVRLLVDSGTSGLLVYGKWLTQNRAAIYSERNPLISTAVGSMLAVSYRASEVFLGKESLGSQTVLVADGDPDPRYHFDGLLGFAKIGFRRVWFDFDNGVLAWE